MPTERPIKMIETGKHSALEAQFVIAITRCVEYFSVPYYERTMLFFGKKLAADERVSSESLR